MRTIVLFSLILTVSFFYSERVSAQSFLKKLTKGIESVSKEVDKVLKTGSEGSEQKDHENKEKKDDKDLTKTFIKLELNKEGVGCLKKGLLFSKIPARCAGLYDRIEKTFEENAEYGDLTVYTFYLGKEKVAEIWDTGYSDKVSNITVYSSDVSTPDGVCPGMSVNKLLAIKGVEGDYGDGICLILNEYTIDFDGLTAYGQKIFDEAYRKGTRVKLSNACFKEDAKVVSISN